jgi:hypothetical protein
LEGKVKAEDERSQPRKVKKETWEGGELQMEPITNQELKFDPSNEKTNRK